MTYCVGILTRHGLVLAADSRTNAGVDHIATVRKLALFERPGARIMALLSAGNLATTQAVVTLLSQRRGGAQSAHDLDAAATLFDGARIVGAVLREVIQHDGKHVQPHGDPSACFLFAGQLEGGRHRLFLIYPAGNFIEATPETPFLQVGETKYGKPILDRVITYEASLAAAAKCALLSFDATIRSNLSVAPPIDLLCYRRQPARRRPHRHPGQRPLLHDPARTVQPRHARPLRPPPRPLLDRRRRLKNDDEDKNAVSQNRRRSASSAIFPQMHDLVHRPDLADELADELSFACLLSAGHPSFW